jgi:hypothetical protein
VAYGYRNSLQVCRDYGDFWYKEMDKFLGGCIFGFLFFLSLLPGGVVTNHAHLELVLLRRHGDEKPSARVDYGHN